jgi:hypothetical protein
MENARRFILTPINFSFEELERALRWQIFLLKHLKANQALITQSLTNLSNTENFSNQNYQAQIPPFQKFTHHLILKLLSNLLVKNKTNQSFKTDRLIKQNDF